MGGDARTVRCAAQTDGQPQLTAYGTIPSYAASNVSIVLENRCDSNQQFGSLFALTPRNMVGMVGPDDLTELQLC